MPFCHKDLPAQIFAPQLDFEHMFIYIFSCSPFANKNKCHWHHHHHHHQHHHHQCRRCINSHFHGNSNTIMTFASQSTCFRLSIIPYAVFPFCFFFCFCSPAPNQRTRIWMPFIGIYKRFLPLENIVWIRMLVLCCFVQRFMLSHMRMFFNLNGAFIIIHARDFRVNFHVILHIKSW